MMKNFTKSLGAFFLLLFSSQFTQALVLDVSHEPMAVFYTLSWTAVEPSTTDAKVTYRAYSIFGYRDPLLGTASGWTEQTSIILSPGAGTQCFLVVSSDSLNGPAFVSNTRCHGFVHNLTEEGWLRGDGDGSQRGFKQAWDITYSLDRDAYVTAAIYPPGTTVTYDAFGFVDSFSSPPIKTLVNNTPRSAEMASHSILNKERWDSRNSSGAIVANGIYYVYVSATLDPGQSGYSVNPLRDTLWGTIPVDIIRIMNIETTGISLTQSVATISYDLTGDANVRMIVARPGSRFYVDSNGQIQTMTAGGVPDASLIISSQTYYRTAGNAILESWDGTTSTGAIVESGLYPVGLSAVDPYGRFAIDNSGNDGPIFVNVTVERAPGSVSTPDVGTDTTAPTLTSISPANGATSNVQVTTITIALADVGAGGAPGTINSLSTDITVTSLSGVIPGSSYTRTFNSSTNQFTLAFNPPLNTNGTYTVSIAARDGAGNLANLSSSFTIDIRLDAASFGQSFKVFPNPAKGVNQVTFQYDRAVVGTTDIEIFTPLGQKVATLSYNDTTSGTGIQQTWGLVNSSGEKLGSGLYIVRIKAHGDGSSVEVKKKLVIVR